MLRDNSFLSVGVFWYQLQSDEGEMHPLRLFTPSKLKIHWLLPYFSLWIHRCCLCKIELCLYLFRVIIFFFGTCDAHKLMFLYVWGCVTSWINFNGHFMIQAWSDESLYLSIIFMHFYCFIFVMGFKMQYSTLFVCVSSHDQVMDIWCFRSVWRFSCLQEECERGGSPDSLASASQISDFAREHVCCTQHGAL